MAAPMSPLIFSLPVMYAVVGFCSPATIFSNVSPVRADRRVGVAGAFGHGDLAVGDVDEPLALALDVEEVRVRHPGELRRVGPRSRLSKNSLAATGMLLDRRLGRRNLPETWPFGTWPDSPRHVLATRGRSRRGPGTSRTCPDGLRCVAARQVPLDQEQRELVLRRGEAAAVLLERQPVGAPAARRS